jgi:hypothetical protein
MVRRDRTPPAPLVRAHNEKTASQNGRVHHPHPQSSLPAGPTGSRARAAAAPAAPPANWGSGTGGS